MTKVRLDRLRQADQSFTHLGPEKCVCVLWLAVEGTNKGHKSQAGQVLNPF